MIEVGLLSDTHLRDVPDMVDLVESLLQGPFKKTTVILHAGDMINPDVLTLFGARDVYAVQGNCDPSHCGCPVHRSVKIGRHHIGLIHGWGAPHEVEQNCYSHFDPMKVAAIVFGHSHQPVCHYRGQVLMVNPGSPTDKRAAPEHTVGLLRVTDEAVTGQIIPLPW